MKVNSSNKIFTTLITLLATATMAIAGQEPGTCATGSVHDMNSFAFVLQDKFERVCAFCHIPHNANSAAGTLWSRPLDQTASGLKPYTWTAPPNRSISQQLDPLTGPSRLCMTCHDGSIALDAHGAKMPVDKIISKDLNITHPIGFSYDEAMTARGATELIDKNEPFATMITLSNDPAERNAVERHSSRKIQDVLYMGQIVTCSSCHDVHNCNNVKPDAGHTYNYLLWAKEENSLICLSCHNK